jgi:hypothetical protein
MNEFPCAIIVQEIVLALYVTFLTYLREFLIWGEFALPNIPRHYRSLAKSTGKDFRDGAVVPFGFLPYFLPYSL